MARDGAIDVTEFISERVPEVVEELTNTVYDLDLLKKKGYTTKNGMVFAHAGNMIADSMEQAFAALGLKPRTLRLAQCRPSAINALTGELDGYGNTALVDRRGDGFYL